MNIPKPFEQFYSFFLKKKNAIFYALFTLQKPRRLQDFVSTFSKTPNKAHSFMLCPQASQNSGGLIQIFF